MCFTLNVNEAKCEKLTFRHLYLFLPSIDLCLTPLEILNMFDFLCYFRILGSIYFLWSTYVWVQLIKWISLKYYRRSSWSLRFVFILSHLPLWKTWHTCDNASKWKTLRQSLAGGHPHRPCCRTHFGSPEPQPVASSPGWSRAECPQTWSPGSP